MQAIRIVFPRPRETVLETIEIPPPGPGEIRFETEYSIISAGTELANYRALPNTGRTFPFCPGYCAVGRAAELGPGVDEWRVGDRATIGWCGGHRSQILKPAAQAVRIDNPDIDSMEAACTHIASFPMLAVRKAEIEMGEPVMIAGGGILGQFAVQFARLRGAAPLMLADLDPARRKLARELGADAVFDPAAPDFVEQVMACTGGRGAAAVIEVTGQAKALRQALEYVAWEGRIVLLGCTRVSDEPIDFYQYVHRRGVRLIGAHTFARPKLESRPGEWTEADDYRTFLRFLETGRVRARPILSRVIAPGEVPETFRVLDQTPNPPLGFAIDWRRPQPGE